MQLFIYHYSYILIPPTGNIYCIFVIVNSNNCLTHSDKGMMLLQRNRNFSTTFNALYLCVSNNLLTHTHTHTHTLSLSLSLLISKTAFTLLYTCAKRAVFSINKRFSKASFAQLYLSCMCLPITGKVVQKQYLQLITKHRT